MAGVCKGRSPGDKIIEAVFLTTEIPFVRIFGGFPVYTAVSSKKDGNKLLKPETKNKLIKAERDRSTDSDGDEGEENVVSEKIG